MADLDVARVKRTVRALLLSSKQGCTPRQLLSDYEQIVGESLPYEELGYHSMMELIYSIPDVVRVSRTRDTNRTILYGVADDSTKHIAKMVSKQRSVKRYASHLPNSYYPTSRSAPQIPHTFRVQLKTLMLSYPNGLCIDSFMEAFARRFGYYLSYKQWGFTSLAQVLNSVSDILKCEMDPVKQKFVVKQVSKVPPPLQRSTSTRENKTKEVNPQKFSDDSWKSDAEEEVPPLPKSAEIDIPSRKRPPPGSLHSIELSPDKQSFLSELRSPPPISQPRKRPVVPRQLVTRVQELLAANPAGLWVSRFQLEFKEYYNEDLPVSALGFTSVVQLLASLPGCDVERPTGLGDWLVFAKGNKKVFENAASVRACEARVSEGLVRGIHSVLEAYPRGISLRSFATTFQELLQKELPVESIGFPSVLVLLREVPRVEVVKPSDNSLIMVYLRKKKEVEEVEKEGGKTDSRDKTSADDKPSTPPSLPSSYTQQPVPKDTKMCSVYVAFVKTPTCICLQLIGEPTTKALEYLLDDITQFYNSKAGDAYKIENPRVGEPCCTVYANDGYWYRAEITAQSAPDIVEVKYVDYGNSGQVAKGSIRRPKPHYLTLPAQAVECRLANLKPAGGTWSCRATQLLHQMTKDKPIVAIVTSIKDNRMSVCLCDTTTERDIHINDTLVAQGLALFVCDTEEDQKSFDSFKLEPLPQGSTGDTVPEVRLPSSKGRVEEAASDGLPATPTLSLPTSSPDPLQVQNYLQHLLLLQQQNALLLTQPALLQQSILAGQTGLGMLGGSQPMSGSMIPFPPGIVPQNSSAGMQPGMANRGIFASQGSGNVQATSAYNSVPVATAAVQNRQSTYWSGPHAYTTVSPTSPLQAQVWASGFHSAQQATASLAANHTAQTSGAAQMKSRSRLSNEEGQPGSLLLVKRVQLTDSLCLHVLRHNDRAYVLSSEVSLWFWDSDLLQSMLRQVQKPVWGLLLQDRRSPGAFRCLGRSEVAELIERRREITVYSLDDLPLIVTTFNAPPDLQAAVKREVSQWQAVGLDYFSRQPDKSPWEREMEELNSALKELRLKRKEILVAMVQCSDEEGPIGRVPLEELVEIEKSIAAVKDKLGSEVKKTLENQADNKKWDETSQTLSSHTHMSFSQEESPERLDEISPISPNHTSQHQSPASEYHTPPQSRPQSGLDSIPSLSGSSSSLSTTNSFNQEECPERLDEISPIPPNLPSQHQPPALSSNTPPQSRPQSGLDSIPSLSGSSNSLGTTKSFNQEECPERLDETSPIPLNLTTQHHSPELSSNTPPQSRLQSGLDSIPSLSGSSSSPSTTKSFNQEENPERLDEISPNLPSQHQPPALSSNTPPQSQPQSGLDSIPSLSGSSSSLSATKSFNQEENPERLDEISPIPSNLPSQHQPPALSSNTPPQSRPQSGLDSIPSLSGSSSSLSTTKSFNQEENPERLDEISPIPPNLPSQHQPPALSSNTPPQSRPQSGLDSIPSLSGSNSSLGTIAEDPSSPSGSGLQYSSTSSSRSATSGSTHKKRSASTVSSNSTHQRSSSTESWSDSETLQSQASPENATQSCSQSDGPQPVIPHVTPSCSESSVLANSSNTPTGVTLNLNSQDLNTAFQSVTMTTTAVASPPNPALSTSTTNFSDTASVSSSFSTPTTSTLHFPISSTPAVGLGRASSPTRRISGPIGLGRGRPVRSHGGVSPSPGGIQAAKPQFFLFSTIASSPGQTLPSSPAFTNSKPTPAVVQITPSADSVVLPVSRQDGIVPAFERLSGSRVSIGLGRGRRSVSNSKWQFGSHFQSPQSAYSPSVRSSTNGLDVI